ncbi:MAG: radical SAM protein, partial [Candidatus Bathyarchaeota archaeon]
MNLKGVHLLLTYRCDAECDHCFVWGSPFQDGTMTIQNLKEIFRQGKSLKTVKSIFFEGGEPLLYYPI